MLLIIIFYLKLLNKNILLQIILNILNNFLYEILKYFILFYNNGVTTKHGDYNVLEYKNFPLRDIVKMKFIKVLL